MHFSREWVQSFFTSTSVLHPKSLKIFFCGWADLYISLSSPMGPKGALELHWTSYQHPTCNSLQNHFMCFACACVLSRFSHVQLCVTSWTIAHQTHLPMGFSRQEYWQSGLPFPSPGDLPDPGIKPTSLMSPALSGRFFTPGTSWEAHHFMGRPLPNQSLPQRCLSNLQLRCSQLPKPFFFTTKSNQCPNSIVLSTGFPSSIDFCNCLTYRSILIDSIGDQQN